MRKTRTVSLTFALLLATLAMTSLASAQNVRLSNDVGGGYASAYTLATGKAYTDSVLAECAISRGRQNEPSVAIDPRDSSVILGSSNDYCGVYQNVGGTLQPVGPIWLGYYRSENGGVSFQSSLVPGYPGDTSPYAALARVRTAGAGDPVIAWDAHGRVFFGSESSGDPAGSAKTFGDEWVATFDNPAGENGATIDDGKRFRGSTIVAKGSAAPNLLGVFHDKTSIEADRTGGACDGTVYFAWSRFNGNGANNIYLSRSTDHGASWSNPLLLTPQPRSVQFPDIAVTGNGHVYVSWRSFASVGFEPNAIQYAKSTDCGATFSPPATFAPFIPNDAVDVAAPERVPSQSASDDPPFSEAAPKEASLARDCGDFASHCQSGYTFFRRDTQVRATADQTDKAHEYVYFVYDATKGPEVPTGTTYGTDGVGKGGQAAIFFTRLNGTTGAVTTPKILDAQVTGHQVFPDISADAGVLVAMWWDSRNDPAYDVTRPIGNAATGFTTTSLDVFSTRSSDRGLNWSPAQRLSNFTSNPNYEQFANRTVPFAGDYLWVSSVGSAAYAVWTDWRDTVAGTDPREASAEDNDGADVKQCRTFNSSTGAWSGDTCPHGGGLDQNIYGASVP